MGILDIERVAVDLATDEAALLRRNLSTLRELRGNVHIELLKICRFAPPHADRKRASFAQDAVVGKFFSQVQDQLLHIDGCFLRRRFRSVRLVRPLHLIQGKVFSAYDPALRRRQTDAKLFRHGSL